MMEIIKYPNKENWAALLERPSFKSQINEEAIADIMTQVKENGDKAVLKYTELFDKIIIKEMLVSEEEINSSSNLVSAELKNAINMAKNNIEKFHKLQFLSNQDKIETTAGVTCWKKTVPISKVGLYIPGGSAPLFSTVLMLGIPAMIATCENVILCTPPNSKGEIHPAILYTANLVGIKKIVKVGGAQAIAAMTFGTETIPKVYKIFGPGNQYVTIAKQMAQRSGVAIDMPAGPSELAIIADDDCVASFVAADLLSQAEHGPDSQVVLFTTSLKVAEDVNNELKIQLEDLSRKEIASIALNNSKCIILENMDNVIEMVNEYAPEHLIIATSDEESIAERIVNAGSVFLGNYTPEAAGDYASGTNHTLPTSGFAKAFSGVSTDDFVKKITFQKITEAGITNLGPTIEIMASAEGLSAHKNAISIRLQKLKSRNK